jgi:hypothetical protein
MVDAQFYGRGAVSYSNRTWVSRCIVIIVVLANSIIAGANIYEANGEPRMIFTRISAATVDFTSQRNLQ